jgi:diacylglycerol kinase (ATP)
MQPEPMITDDGTPGPFGPFVAVVDPAAGRGKVGDSLPEIRDALAATGLAHVLRVADGPGSATRITSEALDEGVTFVVAVGDDGTVQDVVNGMFRDGAPIAGDPVLGVVAAGSGCDLVRSFGLPEDISAAARHLTGDATYPLDLMRVTVVGTHGGSSTRYAHNLVMIGLRASVARRTRRLPAFLGSTRRFLAFWSAYVGARRRAVTIRMDTRTHELRAWDVVVGNGQFADGLRLSPRSYPGDGVLDALVFIGPKADAYRMLPRIFMNGGHLPDPGVKELRAKIRVAVDPDRPLPVVADGRVLGSTPATVQVVPGRIRLKL